MFDNNTEVGNTTLGQIGCTYTKDSSDAIKPPSGKVFVAITTLADTVFDSSGGLISETATKFINTETAANDAADGSETTGQGSGGQVVDSVTFPKGVTIFGRWTEIDVNSGSVVAYIG